MTNAFDALRIIIKVVFFNTEAPTLEKLDRRYVLSYRFLKNEKRKRDISIPLEFIKLEIKRSADFEMSLKFNTSNLEVQIRSCRKQIESLEDHVDATHSNQYSVFSVFNNVLILT